MNFLLYGIVAAVILVAVTGGSFVRLTDIKLQAWWALAASFLIQIALDFDFIPVARYDDLGLALLLVSYALMLAFGVANLRLRGMSIALLGVALNALVIAVNAGMPVDMSRIGGCNESPLPAGCQASVKHQPATPDDLLPILGDFIPGPMDTLISYGDLILVAGIIDISFWASRRKRPRADELGADGDNSSEDEQGNDELLMSDTGAPAQALAPVMESAVVPRASKRLGKGRHRDRRIEPDHWAVAPGEEDTWLAQVTGQYEAVRFEVNADDPWSSLREGLISEEVQSVASLVAKTNSLGHSADPVATPPFSDETATKERVPLWEAPSMDTGVSALPTPTMADSEVFTPLLEEIPPAPTAAPELSAEPTYAISEHITIPVQFPQEEVAASAPDMHASGETPSVAELMAQIDAKLADATAELDRNRAAITAWHPAVAS